MTRVFVDTSALVVLLDRDDARHEATAAAFDGLADADLVTHGYVIAETIAVVRRRLGVEGLTALIDGLLPAIEVLAVEPGSHQAALDRYRRSLPTGTSFVDSVSLDMIRDHDLSVVFALDPDLATPGVTILPAEA